MDDAHRAFLQAFLASPVMTFADAQPRLAAIQTIFEERDILVQDITQDELANYISNLNNLISPLDYEIRSIHSQTDPSRTVTYALVNAASDAMTQVATNHSPDEIAFVKKVIDAMFEGSGNKEIFAVPGMQALNIAKQPRNRESMVAATQADGEPQMTQGQVKALTLDQAERVLASLVAEGWFEKSRREYYSLSPRALMELRGWLVDTYDGEAVEEGDESMKRVRFCEGCREILTIGQRCHNRECGCRIHDTCTQGFFRGQTEKRCPRCEAAWTGTDFVGERAAGGRVQNMPVRRGRPSAASRNTQSMANADSDDD
ncbi:DNA repair protein [Aulographum hederae CBS 113979]|uniref:Non-structural maintenance of chromosomes element 1 homolog n=1 Tax=Aulographum hederae CBS 113979 TaxID=1176131 RepID=A0A6G1H1M3_9PEZI|nr:DNA repair protein [Aulographum hederae CBS 113979]